MDGGLTEPCETLASRHELDEMEARSTTEQRVPMEKRSCHQESVHVLEALLMLILQT